MSDTPAPDRLAEVQRLAAALCDQVLDAQIMNRPVPEEQARALVKAAWLLQERGVEGPPMLAQALHGLGQGADRDAVPEGEGKGNSAIQGLSRLVGAFRRDKATP